MRALALATVLSLTAIAVLAQAGERQPKTRLFEAGQPEASPSIAGQTVLAPAQPALRLRVAMPHPRHGSDLPLRLSPSGRDIEEPPGASAVVIGPLSARLGGNGKRAHIARYRLDGVDVFGGSVSGTLDGRGARVYLRWPPSDAE